MSADQLGVVEEIHRMIVWIVPKLNRFPRTHRFLLGDRVYGGLLEALGLLVEAAYTRDKTDQLRRANLELAKVRHLVRVSWELELIGSRHYEEAARRLEALGRSIGAWQKQQQAKR